MPPRSVKMKRRILGFQRRVWWPKWTPASSSSRMETTDIDVPFWLLAVCRRGPGGTGVRRTPAPPPARDRRVEVEKRLNRSRKPVLRKPAYAEFVGDEGAPRPSLEGLADEIRAAAWDLALEVVEEGLRE